MAVLIVKAFNARFGSALYDCLYLTVDYPYVDLDDEVGQEHIRTRTHAARG